MIHPELIDRGLIDLDEIERITQQENNEDEEATQQTAAERSMDPEQQREEEEEISEVQFPSFHSVLEAISEEDLEDHDHNDFNVGFLQLRETRTPVMYKGHPASEMLSPLTSSKFPQPASGTTGMPIEMKELSRSLQSLGYHPVTPIEEASSCSLLNLPELTGLSAQPLLSDDELEELIDLEDDGDTLKATADDDDQDRNANEDSTKANRFADPENSERGNNTNATRWEAAELQNLWSRDQPSPEVDGPLLPESWASDHNQWKHSQALESTSQDDPDSNISNSNNSNNRDFTALHATSAFTGPLLDIPHDDDTRNAKLNEVYVEHKGQNSIVMELVKRFDAGACGEKQNAIPLNIAKSYPIRSENKITIQDHTHNERNDAKNYSFGSLQPRDEDKRRPTTDQEESQNRSAKYSRGVQRRSSSSALRPGAVEAVVVEMEKTEWNGDGAQQPNDKKSNRQEESFPPTRRRSSRNNRPVVVQMLDATDETSGTNSQGLVKDGVMWRVPQNGSDDKEKLTTKYRQTSPVKDLERIQNDVPVDGNEIQREFGMHRNAPVDSSRGHQKEAQTSSGQGQAPLMPVKTDSAEVHRNSSQNEAERYDVTKTAGKLNAGKVEIVDTNDKPEDENNQETMTTSIEDILNLYDYPENLRPAWNRENNQGRWDDKKPLPNCTARVSSPDVGIHPGPEYPDLDSEVDSGAVMAVDNHGIGRNAPMGAGSFSFHSPGCDAAKVNGTQRNDANRNGGVPPVSKARDLDSAGNTPFPTRLEKRSNAKKPLSESPNANSKDNHASLQRRPTTVGASITETPGVNTGSDFSSSGLEQEAEMKKSSATGSDVASSTEDTTCTVDETQTETEVSVFSDEDASPLCYTYVINPEKMSQGSYTCSVGSSSGINAGGKKFDATHSASTTGANKLARSDTYDDNPAKANTSSGAGSIASSSGPKTGNENSDISKTVPDVNPDDLNDVVPFSNAKTSPTFGRLCAIIPNEDSSFLQGVLSAGAVMWEREKKNSELSEKVPDTDVKDESDADDVENSSVFSDGSSRFGEYTVNAEEGLCVLQRILSEDADAWKNASTRRLPSSTPIKPRPSPTSPTSATADNASDSGISPLASATQESASNAGIGTLRSDGAELATPFADLYEDVAFPSAQITMKTLLLAEQEPEQPEPDAAAIKKKSREAPRSNTGKKRQNADTASAAEPVPQTLNQDARAKTTEAPGANTMEIKQKEESGFEKPMAPDVNLDRGRKSRAGREKKPNNGRPGPGSPDSQDEVSPSNNSSFVNISFSQTEQLIKNRPRKGSCRVQ